MHGNPYVYRLCLLQQARVAHVTAYARSRSTEAHASAGPLACSRRRRPMWTSRRSSQWTRLRTTRGISTIGACLSCGCPHTHTHTHRAITAEPCRVHAPCSRVFVAILAGAASGIMGIEGIAGFVTFFASSMVLSLGMYLKMNSNPKPYFKTGSDVWTEGIGQALMVCHHRGDAWHILLRALTRTNPTAAPCSLLTGADACAVIRDVLDAILRHRAHLLSNPTGGSRGTTRHGARAVPGGRARGRADVAVHGQSVSSWCRPRVCCIVTKKMIFFLISWRGRSLRGARRKRGVLCGMLYERETLFATHCH